MLNVIMTIGSRRRMDRAKLFAVIPDYAEAPNQEAAERMFERDKAAILELGLPLATERDVLDENTVYYRIDTAASSARLDLTTEEYTVLLAASRAWDDAAAGGAARRVRAKLLSMGHDADPDLLRRTPRGAVESLPVLSPLLEAVTSGKAVRFTYRSTSGDPAQRHVEPWVVGVHDGHWYLYGWDTDRGAPRMFRASRIESFPAVAGQARQERPEQIDLDDVFSRLTASDDRGRAKVRAVPYKALQLRDRAGAELGAHEFELPELPRPAARRLVLGEIRWADVLEPELWRKELAQVLADIADQHRAEPDLAGLDAATVRPEPRIRTSVSGSDQLSRLIGEASFVLSRGEVELAELAEAVGIDENQVIKDLQVLFLCGDLGTGWEDLIEVEWEHGTVRVRNAEPLRRALRLNSVEITALLAGLAALEGPAGETAEILASARRKLLAAAEGQDTPAPDRVDDHGGRDQSSGMWDRAGSRSDDHVAAPSADHAESRTAGRADTVLDAIHASLRSVEDDAGLTVRYSSPDRAGTSVRRIRPLRIETDGARSYLLAHCELARGERRFRLDRIIEIMPEGSEQHPAEEAAGPDLSGVLEEDAWIRLAPPARWIAESFGAVEVRDGAEAQTFARISRPVRAALVDAVFESAGAAEVLAPRELRDTIVTVAETAHSRHTT